MRTNSDRTARVLTRGLLSAGFVASLVGVPAMAGASVHQPNVVSANPSNSTPHVLDDETVANASVFAIAQNGTTMYAGGHFHTVRNATGDISPVVRDNLMAFDAATGAVRAGFKPAFNGPVWAIEPSGSAIFVGGDFTTVNGLAHRGLVKLDAATGAIDTSFTPPITFGKVSDLRLVNGRLLVGGTLKGKLVALNPATGANTKYISSVISGSVASNAGPTEVYRFSVSPDGTRLVAIGNFTTVDGESRMRAFMLALGPTSAALDPWHYLPLDKACRADSLPDQLRGVDFSPDGTYFVIVATGWVPATKAGIGTDVCDAAARFQTNVDNPAKPFWINYTGGDTLHSVAVTGSAVYVQGHQRWLDNPDGNNSPVGTAVARPGIGAIDPASGLALSWNPTKTRGVGGKVFYATSAGLWVGSDGTYIGQPRERRPGIAFMPLP
jgi:hypothetical protein